MRVSKSKAGSWVDGRGFRKVIGGKRFDLGKDEQTAIVAALQLEALFLSAQGWSTEALAAAEGIRTAPTKQNAPELTVTQPARVVVKPLTVLTVNAAIERYRSAMTVNARDLPSRNARLLCRE